MYDFVAILWSDTNVLVLPVLWTGFISVPALFFFIVCEEYEDWLDQFED